MWDIVVIPYRFRVTGLRSEFYKLASKYLPYAKIFLSSLEGRIYVASSEYIDEFSESSIITWLRK